MLATSKNILFPGHNHLHFDEQFADHLGTEWRNVTMLIIRAVMSQCMFDAGIY